MFIKILSKIITNFFFFFFGWVTWWSRELAVAGGHNGPHNKEVCFCRKKALISEPSFGPILTGHAFFFGVKFCSSCQVLVTFVINHDACLTTMIKNKTTRCVLLDICVPYHRCLWILASSIRFSKTIQITQPSLWKRR